MYWSNLTLRTPKQVSNFHKFAGQSGLSYNFRFLSILIHHVVLVWWSIVLLSQLRPITIFIFFVLIFLQSFFATVCLHSSPMICIIDCQPRQANARPSTLECGKRTFHEKIRVRKIAHTKKIHEKNARRKKGDERMRDENLRDKNMQTKKWQTKICQTKKCPETKVTHDVTKR